MYTYHPDLHALPSTSPSARAGCSNPLVDLIDTETVYVDQLTGIVPLAAAWSRTNLPPDGLDLMFHSLERVYKADRSLLACLKEIGTNPSPSKALGGLFMRWLRAMGARASRHDINPDTDTDMPHRSEGSRRPIPHTASDTAPALTSGSPCATTPASPASSPPSPRPSRPPVRRPPAPDLPVWTLDELFLLPKTGLKYFKKLYARPSDYELLSGAAEKLDKLLGTLDGRSNVKAGAGTPAPAVLETEDEVVVDFRSPAGLSKARVSSAARSSNDTSLSSIDPRPAENLQIPLLELEGCISGERCLDIFTMKPRQVRLQFLTPTLPYARTVRIGVDADIRFVPQSTGVEANHLGCRIFILSDLFLVSERMAPGERSTDSPAADMWLLYPPFTEKHLKLAKTEGDDRALDAIIIRREKLTLVFASVPLRDKVLFELGECVGLASAGSATWRADTGVHVALELSRWMFVLLSFVFFGFFGFAEGGRAGYRSVYRWLIRRV
ncbi:hypothetical protein BC834DRAFT_967372 [Gloeopeniophorella convolvens]|nr:hypothetical protein BC834DRAFT_967372 [Gloeopeniophorella convolvens]